MDEHPLVSICCQTYNHEEYIEKCIEGVLKQRTNFSYELLIHDDASKDRTATIVREYESRFPKTIQGFYQQENQFLKQNTLVNILYKNSRGKYIAICDGDDYWTDPFKLQKQVDFLEKNPGTSLIYHNIVTNRPFPFSFQKQKDFFFSLKDTLRIKQGAAVSMVFINFLKDKRLPEFYNKVVSGDWSLEVILMTMGKGYYMKETMGFYRHHEAGITKRDDFIRKANKAKWYFILRMVFWSPKHSISFIRFLYRNRSWARY